MGRINSNVPSLIARNNLDRAGQDLNLRLERLATGLRINRGRDDPAGLIISERLRSEINGVEAGIRNAERASSVIATTESSLAEVNELLNSIKGLIVESANTGANSEEERRANQLQINSAIDSITRIANTASFGGLNLLNGDLDYTTSGQVTSQIARVDVTGATLIDQASLQVTTEVLTSAQTAGIYLSARSAGFTSAGVIENAATLRIRGSLGVTTINIASSVTFTDLVNTVNNLTTVTGVSASLVNGGAASGIVFNSTEYGADEFVSVERIDDPVGGNPDPFDFLRLAEGQSVPAAAATWTGGTFVSATRDTGRDTQALINGTVATGDGLNISINTSTLSVSLLLDETFAITPDGTTTSFDITGGGALFQLGPDVSALQQSSIGVRSIASELLGGTLVGGELNFLSSLKEGQPNDIRNSVSASDFSAANAIIDQSIDDITILRGRLGAFERNTLQTNVRSLQASFENLSASSSVIRDADFALETSALTRAQTLSAASQSTLALANQQAGSVLQLLG
ncbi:MAG: flagellin [Planctomycetota bacterium]